MAVIDFSCGPEEWDLYVTGHPAGIFSLLWAWGESLASVYGLKIFRIAARHDSSGNIGGILPLILFDPPGGELRLISLPYTDTAGLLADDAKMEASLLSAGLMLADELNTAHLEIRQAGEKQALTLAFPFRERGFCHRAYDFKVGLRRHLPPVEAELWQGVGPKVRNQIRKARKCGCKAEVGGPGMLDAFYGVFSENMRDLGSPVHDRAVFDTLARRFSRAMRVVTVSCDGVPAAASILFVHKGVVSNPWASSLRRFRPACPNMLLYWTMMVYALESGSAVFDFGRSSPHASTCRFKLQWGAEIQPMTWHLFSKENHQWDPMMESLVHEDIKDSSLETSRRMGPLRRKWISL